MRELEEKILSEGKVLPGEVLKVGSFLNQQLDVTFLMKMGEEIARLFKDSGITKVLTIEASGIAIAVAAAYKLGVSVVFAKKNKSSNVGSDVYATTVFSYTHNIENNVIVSKDYMNSDDVILIVDDFLAKGAALEGLIRLVNQAEAKCAGCAIAIEKGFQGGGDSIRAKGIRVESLAIIDSMDDTSVTFREQN